MKFPKENGTYILVFNYRKSREVKVKSRNFFIDKGRYCYIGSAFGLGGISSRVFRHLKKRKKKHWHLDFLSVSPFFEVISVYCFLNLKIECKIAKRFLEIFSPVVGFGASDCSCISHLFFIGDRNLKEIDKIIEGFPFKRFDFRG